MAAAEEGAAACSITLTEVLEALADAPQAYKVGTGAGGSGGGGSGGGFSKRKVCWFGPVSYTYGGQSFPPRWPLPGPKLQQLLAAVSAAIGVAFNAVNVNVYHEGEQAATALARHRDDEPIFACEAVASVSFGASRRFVIYHPEGGADTPHCIAVLCRAGSSAVSS